MIPSSSIFASRSPLFLLLAGSAWLLVGCGGGGTSGTQHAAAPSAVNIDLEQSASTQSSPTSAIGVSGQGTWETTLQARDLDGNTGTAEAYYDTVLGITWLADANLAATHTFGVPGIGITASGSMTGDTAENWIAAMNADGGTGYLGYNRWHLPTMMDTNGPGCDYSETGGTDCGYNVQTINDTIIPGSIIIYSELAHLYYDTLRNIAWFDTDGLETDCYLGDCLSNSGPFFNVQANYYWFGTGYRTETYNADFGFNNGNQSPNFDYNDHFFAWPVHDGDIGVPLVLPSIKIDKLTNGNQADGANDPDVPRIAQGATVTWTYQVTNTGEVAVSEAELVITDSQPGITPMLDTASDTGSDLLLSPGETWSYTSTAQALDLSAPPEGVTVVTGCNDGRNTYENAGRVEVSGTDVFDEDLSHYCNPGGADIDIRKQEDGPDTRTIVRGSDVSFEIQVTNNGFIDLNNVGVTDTAVPQCNNTIGFLGVGASTTYSCTAPKVATSLTNEACVAGETPAGLTFSDCDTSAVEVIAIDIRKQAEGADTRAFPSGSDVPFEIVVTNTSDQDLSNVSVSDTVVPACDNAIGDMAAGDSVTYTCIAPAVIASLDNEACVAGERNGVAVQDCDRSTVKVIAANKPPDCSGAVASVGMIWPPNHKFVAVDILGITDPDGDPVMITIDRIFQDEPVNGPGDGNTAPDAGGIGTDTALVRAERSGKGNGRVYGILVIAEDVEGESCMGEVSVGVPHNRKTAPKNDGLIYDSTVR